MKRIRVIPTLLLKNGGLVKTTRFCNPVYVGDPINAVKIFNEKEVDELILLDVDASRTQRGPDLKLVEEIAGECFMPMAYGGGVTQLDQIKALFAAGVEKVVLNTAFMSSPELITKAANIFGCQSIVVSLDVRRSFMRGYRTYICAGSQRTRLGPVEAARKATASGAGEIYLNAIDRDGTQKGYDLPLIREVADAVTVPVIAAGGASNVDDFANAVLSGHASAVSAGSMFVFHGIHRAVLISYPQQNILVDNLFSKVA